MRPLSELSAFLDTFLRIGEVPDAPNAVNGLQVEACTEVSALACAVDASEQAIEEAARRGAQLLLVHHGLFWSGNRPITGSFARKLRRCFEAGLSVYSAHAPLDVHPECGNNAVLLRTMGMQPEGPFGRYQGTDIGMSAQCDLTLEQLRDRLIPAVGKVRVFGKGPERIHRVAVVTGAAGGLVAKAASNAADALITGEAAHHHAVEAEELGVHLILGGHYRTETLGVQALAAVIADRFGLATSFIEHDTGL